MKMKGLVLVVILLVTMAGCAAGREEQYIDVNGVSLAYVRQGEGEPLILLHGGGGSGRSFDHVIDRLSETFTVYAIDSRGQGKSSAVGEYNYQDMADDAAAFINELQLDHPALYGFSDGGIVGLILASQHPVLLSKLMVSGANADPSGIVDEDRAVMERSYSATGDGLLKMELTQPHLTVEDLNRIRIPVLVTAGSDDMIKESHTRFIAENIPGSRLEILQGETHTSYVLESTQVADLIEDFLKK